MFNPFDPVFRANPYPFYAQWREQAPVMATPLGFTVLTRYEDVARTLRGAEFARDIEAHVEARPDDPRSARRERLRERRDSGEIAKSILNLDPPDHTRLRRLVSLAFTPSAIERLRPRVQSLVDDVLDRAADRGTMEVVEELAFPVPFQVISDLLDLPTDGSEQIREWSQTLTASLEPTADDATMAAVGQACRQAVQAPQWLETGGVGGRAMSTKISPRKNIEPASRLSSSVCLPRQPRPLWLASCTSSTGAESVNTRCCSGPTASAMRSASFCRRLRSTLW